MYKSLQEGTDHELSEKLVTYLNFFEFIASLWKMNQLSVKEIHFLFDYYVRLIERHPEVFEFVKGHGFENLEQMISRMKEVG